ncbi:MAG: tRNA (N6-threonylcarbamoyladenosine(37)-N6)-methyltransferase TrmO [Methanocorpusculum sp.]|nr:tRNA (N6-threonylcarbamoyladenosine(37)-N6)-methyltransferase TrmO [Methanocorpusculum sp.]MBR4117961.1 tRNA (N6-threonylcarbamoyladenosine(37)-N6)-methyltransferase TrmO [Methanocorpusculum sp.]HJJ76838.1 tRNA (N6-threonylcarbamoyladenosine(37)-N6)-methyltransferase TrmO [Methanocorpusculum sp.]
MSEIICTPIGFVSSPFKERGDAPRQGYLTDETSVITLKEEYLKATLGLEEGADIFVLCWFDRSDRTLLLGRPSKDVPLKGVFANRSPNRPNPISLTLVKIVKIEDNKITVVGLEALDGTPVLDIKPYSKDIDTPR